MTTAEKLTTIAENQQKVYDAGHEAGYLAGAKSEYDRFWDEFQNKGGKASYFYAFYGDRFNDETYNPKYDIVCSNGSVVDGRTMFYGSPITDTKVAIFAFHSLDQAFRSAKSLKTIRRLDVSAYTKTMNETFYQCEALETLTMTGTLVASVDLSYSPLLTKDSITSVINTMSATATGQTATFSQTAVNNAFTTEEWNALKATKSNWTIALA